MIETIAEIDAPHFLCGIVLWDDVVIEAAPIVRKHLKGRTRAYVREFCKTKGWKVSVVHEIKRERP